VPEDVLDDVLELLARGLAPLTLNKVAEDQLSTKQCTTLWTAWWTEWG
jgi:hypothetical protein